MNSSNNYRFYVIEINDQNYNGTDKCVCVPTSWIQKRDTETEFAAIKYPDEDSYITKRRVKMEWNYDDGWGLLFGNVKYGTDNYTDAQEYINLLNSQAVQGQNYDETLREGGTSLASDELPNRQHVSRQTHSRRTDMASESTQSTMTQPRQILHGPRRREELYSEIHRNRQYEGRQTRSHRTEKALGSTQSTMTQSRQAVQSPRRIEEHYSEIHRSILYEGRQTRSHITEKTFGSTQSTVTQPRQAIQGQIRIEEFHSATHRNRQHEGRQTRSDKKEKVSGSTQSAVTQPRQAVQSQRRKEELYTEMNRNREHEGRQTRRHRKEKESGSTQSTVTQPRQAIHSPNTIEKLSSLLDKSKTLVRGLKDPQSQIIESVQMPVVSSHHQANDPIATQNVCVSSCEGEVTNVPKKRSSDFPLPPEYDPNDPKWTLKHQELKPNLEELIPYSALYVDSNALERSKILADNSKELLTRLLPEVFNEIALNICTRTGTGKRPRLESDALKFLLKYIINYAENSGWPVVSLGELEKSIPNILKKFRQCQSNDNNLSTP